MVAIALTAALVACGSAQEEDEPPPTTQPSVEVVEATPFRLHHLPDGYEVHVIGDGDDTPPLVTDFGENEPGLLVVPDGWDGADLSAVVSVRAQPSMGGGGGFAPGVEGEELDVDGRPALLIDARVFQGVRHPRQLVVDVGRVRESEEGSPIHWQLRIIGDVDDDVLEELARGATVGPDRVPVVPAPPDGWRIESRMTLPQLAVTGIEQAFPVDRHDLGHLGIDGYAMVLAGPPIEQQVCPEWGYEHHDLAVSSVDGSAHHLAAIATLRADGIIWFGCENEVRSVAELEVDGRPAWYSQGAQDTVLAFVAPAGNVAIIRSVGPDALDRDELLRVAEGYESVDAAAWEAQQIELRGGPGLHPDEGREEIARGEFAGETWLLQTSGTEFDVEQEFGSRPAPDHLGGADFPVAPGSLPDSCILLGSGGRVCTTSSGFGNGLYDDAGSTRMTVRFEVGLVKPQVVRVRVTLASGGLAEVDTVAVPGGAARVYVVPTAPDDAGVAIDFLAADGSVIPRDEGR